jgi:putative pyruvate formate lyase activating enzyme
MNGVTRRDLGHLIGGSLVLPATLACRGEQQPASISRKTWRPAYVRLEAAGELAGRVEQLNAFYTNCRLCPRECGVNRLEGEKGVCRSSSRAMVFSSHPHFGEERPLVGRRGSGTVFFSNCNLRCVFCQNWEINHRGDGSAINSDDLARAMLKLQNAGCHNINLVTPSHYVPSIVEAVRTASQLGLRIPLVYNCSGYEPLEVIKLLDGIVDIYLPDFKYGDGVAAAKYSPGAHDYPEVATAAIAEMRRQVGDVIVDEDGIAVRGVMVRHLVLPNNLAGTDRFVRIVAEKFGLSTYVNLMSQYHPAYQALRYPELSRRVTTQEYSRAVEWAKEAGLLNVHLQG